MQIDRLEPMLITRQEAARLLAISPRKLDELKAGQQIPFVQIGKAIRFDMADLRSWIAELKTPVRGGSPVAPWYYARDPWNQSE